MCRVGICSLSPSLASFHVSHMCSLLLFLNAEAKVKNEYWLLLSSDIAFFLCQKPICMVFSFHFSFSCWPNISFFTFLQCVSSTFPSTFDGVTDCSLSLAVFIFHFSEWLVVKTAVFFTFFSVFHFLSLPLLVCVFLTENSLFSGSKLSHEKAFVTGLHSPA